MASSSKNHNRTPSAILTSAADGDNPQSMVISSLRSQIGDLVSQVTQLNSKLVQSYDRISDLEDNLHIASSNLRNSTLKISQLELERTQHLSALNIGLLVEKSHVTSELNRLMERATEEAARRGKAESARREIEKDLDDLSAELFERANNMVAEARLAQAKSERRVHDTETALKGAEDAVTSMQSQMQLLREQKDRTDRELGDMREIVGKGKWVERDRPASAQHPLRLLSTHAPYQDFLLFVAHLRQIRAGTPQPPPMATLLPLPFLSRLIAEDSDPTLRLDVAPALNWLTRRAVGSAIHQSQLIVEPVAISILLEAQAPPGSAAAIAAFSSSQPTTPSPTISAVTCALCGVPVFSSAGSSNQPYPQSASASSWRPAFFTRNSSNSAPTHAYSQSQSQPPRIHSPTPSVATSSSFYPPSSSSRLSPPPTPPPMQTQVHVFRVPATGSGLPTLYPICTSGWCLARLRTTCEAWRFLRRGVVEKVWGEEVPAFVELPQQQAQGKAAAKPPLPPRRRMNVGKLIGMVVGNKGSVTANGSATVGSSAEEKFSPPPIMGRRSSAGGRKVSYSETAPLVPPPPLPKRSDTRSAKPDVEKERDAKNVHSGALVEGGATLFDASLDIPTPKQDEHRLQEPPAKVDSDDPSVSTPAKVVDPAQIPLPPSPTPPPKLLADENEQRPTGDLSEATKDPSHPGTNIAGDGVPSRRSAEGDAEHPIQEQTHKKSPSGDASTPTRLSSSFDLPRATSPAPPPVPRRAARRAVPAPPPGAGVHNKAAASEPDSAAAAKVDPEANSVAADSGQRPPAAAQEQPQLSTIAPENENPPLPPSGPELHASLPQQHTYSQPHEVSSSPLPPPPPPPSHDQQPHEPYIGEATWEERTWKELVRLREDMFYARIGTAR